MTGIKLNIAYAVTVPITAWSALRGQLDFLRRQGNCVTLASSPGDDLDSMASHEQIEVKAIPTEREISLFHDLVSFWHYWRYWSTLRPHITNVGTPKAGLVAGLASWLARVPIRVYTLLGLRLETTSGLKRVVLTAVERVACAAAHCVVCVSPSLRDEAIRLKLCDPRKLIVLGSGSANGIESATYSNRPSEIELQRLRSKLNLPSDVPVIGFVGRFTKDKGVSELVKAFERLRLEFSGLRLLLVGVFEEGDPVPNETRIFIKQNADIIVTGYVPETVPYYHLMSVFALPTYREGFPGVLLEAAAAGLPIVTTNATGARDAVLHERTGLIVNVADVLALTDGLKRILSNAQLAKNYGLSGQEWVKTEFAPIRVWENIERLYSELALQHGIKP